MTSLAHQLKRLALPQNDASLLTRKEIASLLFEPKEAATIDRSTFYALGELLSRLNPISSVLSWAQVCMFLPHVRLQWCGGTAGNRGGLPGVQGHPVQLGISDDGAQRPVQRSQPEAGRQHLTLPHPPVPVLPPQTSPQVPGVADSPVCMCWFAPYRKPYDVALMCCFILQLPHPPVQRRQPAGLYSTISRHQHFCPSPAAPEDPGCHQQMELAALPAGVCVCSVTFHWFS